MRWTLTLGEHGRDAFRVKNKILDRIHERWKEEQEAKSGVATNDDASE